MALYDDAAGRPIQKVFNRIGIRRDQNFADLSSPTAGLGNLIDTLIDDDENTFIAEDLGVINNIFSRGLTNGNYLSVAGSAVRFVVPDGTKEEYFDPRITYQNRLDKIQVFSGDPRLAGGNGLTAKYYQNDQITFDNHSDFEYNVNPNFPAGIATITPSGDVFTGITTLGQLPDDNFWEEGDFEYSRKVHPQSAKANTGIKWEGYFIPSITGPVDFYIISTGYFTLDFQQEGYEENDNKIQTTASVNAVGAGNTFKEYMRIGVSTQLSVSTGVGKTITIPEADRERMNTIGIGMSVSGSNIKSNVTVEGISKSTGNITLFHDSDAPLTSQITSSTDVTFFRDLNNSTEVNHTITTQVLEAYKKYRIRIRYFYHKNFNSSKIIQKIDVNYKQRNFATQTDLRFNKLFSLDYNFSENAKGEFNKFNDNSVLFGGTDTEGIGDKGDTSGQDYARLITTNKIDIKYTPKTTLDAITRSQISVVKTGGSNVLTMGAGSLTTNIEVGNYIIGTQSNTNASVSFFARVSDLLQNEIIVMDRPANSGTTHTETVRFIDHRGFVRRVRVNEDIGNTLQSSDTTNPFVGTAPDGNLQDPDMESMHRDVQKDMFAVGAGIPAFTRVLSLPSQTDAQLSSNVNVSANQDVFFYDSKGLRDNTFEEFCDRIDDSRSVECLVSDNSGIGSAPVGVGIHTITVDDAKSVGIDWELQGAYFTVAGDTIASAGIKVTNVQGNEITLESGITKPLPDGAQFTAVDDTKDEGDYTLCCPPTDTSPPFDASEEGLNTTPDHKNLGIVSGNLKFDSLLIQDDQASNNATDLATGQSTAVDRTIDIKTPSGTFKILATT